MIQEASPLCLCYTQAFIGSKFCPSLIDNISLTILCHTVRIFILFSIGGKNCPSISHATAGNLVCSDIYMYIYIQGYS
jgi:hypothetical protein